jgi:serine/threonine protein kinase
MAPEIVREKTYNEKVDVWSLGCITHIMLTGCPPFFARDKKGIFDAIKDKKPGFGNMKNKLSVEAVELVDKMLEKDPANRFSMEEVLNHAWL